MFKSTILKYLLPEIIPRPNLPHLPQLRQLLQLQPQPLLQPPQQLPQLLPQQQPLPHLHCLKVLQLVPMNQLHLVQFGFRSHIDRERKLENITEIILPFLSSKFTFNSSSKK